ncbi:ankyrin repeat-containing domain protein [Boletus edulis]|nr:ankyrin repeat-containing domain protein [Boletus edulis]
MPDYPWDYPTTVEDYAEHRALKETLKFLFGLGCNPLQPSSQGEIPLCIALEQGYITAARIFLALYAPSSSPCDVLWVVLKSTQFQRKLRTIDFLIDQGVSVFVKTENEDSMLHVAIAFVSFDEVLQVVALLLRRGCDPTIPNPRGATPFHVAVERGCLSVVKLFLWLNIPLPADILFTAIQSPRLTPQGSNHRLTIVKALVTAGCESQARNAAGLTPLDVAYNKGHFDVADYLLSASVSTRPSGE